MILKPNRSLVAAAILIGFMALTGVLPLSVTAQDESPSSATDSADEEATQNLKDRIERVVKDKQDEIDDTIETLSSVKRGFVGQVTRLSEEAITIKNPKGTQIVSVTEDVEITRKGDDINLDDIAVDEWAHVLGLEQGDVFQPVRVTISTSRLRPQDYTVELGSVTDISSSNISISPRSALESEVAFSLNSKTEYQDLNGNEIDRQDITESTQVLVVGYTEDDERTATTIRALTVFEDELDESEAENADE